MERDPIQQRRGRRRSEGTSTAGTAPVRLARLVRAPVPSPSPSPAVSEASVVIELDGIRVSVGRDADPGVVAVVLALLGGAR